MARKYRGSAVQLDGIPHPDLVVLIRTFCEVTKRGATGVCHAATGDDKLLWDLQGGRKIGMTLRAALITYIQTELHALDDGLNRIENHLTAAMREA